MLTLVKFVSRHCHGVGPPLPIHLLEVFFLTTLSHPYRNTHVLHRARPLRLSYISGKFFKTSSTHFGTIIVINLHLDFHQRNEVYRCHFKHPSILMVQTAHPVRIFCIVIMEIMPYNKAKCSFIGNQNVI